jgi:hypothetical protein
LGLSIRRVRHLDQGDSLKGSGAVAAPAIYFWFWQKPLVKKFLVKKNSCEEKVTLRRVLCS